MITGLAEVFGHELIAGFKYAFRGYNFAVWTFAGCTLRVSGQPMACYIAKEAPVISYGNVHAVLHQRREASRGLGRTGPRVMIVGPQEVGKSTLARILANYAVKMGGRPMFVDLDTADSKVALPGTIAAVSVDRPLNASGEFDSHFDPVVRQSVGLVWVQPPMLSRCP